MKSVDVYKRQVVGLAFALASFFRRHGFCCCDNDDLEDYYYDEDDDDCCCDEGPIRIDDIQPQTGDDASVSAPAEEDDTSL